MARIGDILTQPLPKPFERRIIAYSLIGFVLVLVVLSLLPHMCCNGRDAERIIRQANLRGIWGFVAAFPDVTEDGRFPEADRYGELLLEQFEFMPSPLFGPEDTQDDIWIVPIPWPDRRIPDNLTPYQLGKIPLLHERVDLNPDGTSVAFWDGSVRLLTNEEFEAIIDVDQSVCLACEFGTNNWLKKQEP